MKNLEFYLRIPNEQNYTGVLVIGKIDLLWWQIQGLQYTASGYGSKIPTKYKVQYNKRWHRVYCMIYSNAGTYYIISKGEKIIVDN